MEYDFGKAEPFRIEITRWEPRDNGITGTRGIEMNYDGYEMGEIDEKLIGFL